MKRIQLLEKPIKKSQCNCFLTELEAHECTDFKIHYYTVKKGTLPQ